MADNEDQTKTGKGPDDETKGILKSLIGEAVEEKLNEWSAKNTPKSRTSPEQPTFLQSLFGQY